MKCNVDFYYSSLASPHLSRNGYRVILVIANIISIYYRNSH